MAAADRWVSVLEEDLSDVTLETQISAVKRELALRANVYPKRIAAGKLTQAAADKETRAMRAVLKTLFQLQAARALEAATTPPLPIDDNGFFVSFL